MKRVRKMIPVTVLFAVMTIAFSTACKQGERRSPENLIPEHLMVQVLADFFLVEGVMIQLEYIHQKMPDSAVPLYHVVFEKHGVTRDAFRESLDYYATDATQIDRLYDLTILQISKEQTRIGKEQQAQAD